MKQKHLGLLIGGLSALGGAAITTTGFVIANAVQNKQNYSQYLQASISDAYGRIGKEAIDALTRSPEEYDKISSYVSLLTNALESDWITPQKALAIGIFGGGDEYLGMTAGKGSISTVSRVLQNKDETVFNTISNDTKALIETIKATADDAAFALGVAATTLFDSFYRMQDIHDDLYDLIETSLKPFYQYINSNNSFSAGKIISNAMDAMARQPDSIGSIKEIAYIEVNKLVKSNLTFMQANAYGIAAAGGMDAISRQPESKTVICRLLYTELYEIINIPSDLSIAYYRIGTTITDAIARQPESYNELNDALSNLIIPSVRKANANNAETIGAIGGAMFDGIARQPSWSNLIIMEAKALIEIVLQAK